MSSFDAHVVMHTHWDREWYHPFERFRQRLVALVDELLDDPPGSDESFLLDGQAIILDDYLAIRTERRDALTALLRAGRLEAGPWFVLADELIPSGEALVRNLLAGRAVLRRLGANPPLVLYCPDSFGHPAALPSLAAGFGLPVVIAWRGYGSARWPAGDTARWVAPDGGDVLLFHLPRDGYEFGSNFPADDSSAAARWNAIRTELGARTATGALLVLIGADHHARQTDWRGALTALERVGRSDGVHRSSLQHFADALVTRAASRELPTVRGELRDSYGYTWTLSGTLATRAHEKRLNARAERLLLRDAEPWSALAAVNGRSRRALVDAAWRTVLTAHPHDTLCGCSIDDVALAMEQRLRSAMVQAAGVRDDAIMDLIGHDPVEARTARERWQPIAIVRNRAPRRRSGVAIVDIESFVADVRVGPGSALSGDQDVVVPRRTITIGGLGRVQVLARSLRHSLTESPRHYPDADLVSAARVAAWISDAPPYGLECHPIGVRGPIAAGPREPVVVERRSMRNANLIVTVGDDGTISLEQTGSGRRVASLLELLDETDVGDLYTPAPRPRSFLVEASAVRRIHRGPLRGELAVRYRVADPAASRRVDADVTLHFILDADSPFLRVRVLGVNRSENHRLRLVVRTGVASDLDSSVWADSAFGPIRRGAIDVPLNDVLAEQPPSTAPLHRYVSRFNREAGCTLFSDGLAEYEARDDGSLVVTLLRAVGELSRNDLPERPGHAGWPAHTPLAQCLGPFKAKLAVMLHGPRDAATVDAIERAADDVLLPLRGSTLRSALTVPDRLDGVELEGEGLACSAVKESDDGDWMVLRCVNLLDSVVRGRWRLPFEVADAYYARLDEAQLSKLELTDSAAAFDAPPRGIVTLLVR